uniref:Uncharacterized protein n=1 Tax=Rhizophora mucronata TaxID=61149 RepID=A0A2P2NEZ0_RHIMU
MSSEFGLLTETISTKPTTGNTPKQGVYYWAQAAVK